MDSPYYCWLIKFGSMTELDVQRLKELQHDNLLQRNQIVSDLTLDTTGVLR